MAVNAITANSISSTVAGSPVGKVSILYGTVKAVAPDGTERVLAPNSPVFANDRIVTENDGRVSIIFNDPSIPQLVLGRMSAVAIEEEVAENNYIDEASDQTESAAAEVAEIQQALVDETFDPTVELEAPAAGPAGPLSDGGGHPTVRFESTGDRVTPQSGAETTGVTYNFGDPIPGIAEPELVVTPEVRVGVVLLDATEEITEEEGQAIIYTATVDNPPQGSNLVLLLDNGAEITILVGETTGSTTYIPPGSDDVYRDFGTIAAGIVNATGGDYQELDISDTATTNVVDDTDPVTVDLSVAPTTTSEGGSALTYTATLTGGVANNDITVSLANGETITITAGQSSGSTTTAIQGDDVYVDGETINNHITGAVEANAGTPGSLESLELAADTSVSTVIGDTINTTYVSLSGPPSVVEGEITSEYTVTLSSEAKTNVTVNFSYSGTAADGSDFYGVGSVVIASGSQANTFTIDTIEDLLEEGAEQLTVTIQSVSQSSGGILFENLAIDGDADFVTTTIIDDDGVPEIEVSSQQVDETGGLDSVTGTLAFAYGPNGPGNIALSASGATWNAGASTLMADDGSYKVVVNSDGTYTFTQLAVMDHPVATDPNDAIVLDFNATVTDSDGDSVSDSFSVTVYDDGPIINDISNAVVRNVSGVSLTGILDTTGVDTPYSADLTGSVPGWDETTGSTFAPSGLTSAGKIVYYYVDPDNVDKLIAYTDSAATPGSYSAGNAMQSLVFTLTADPENDSYQLVTNGILDGINHFDTASATSFGAGPANYIIATEQPDGSISMTRSATAPTDDYLFTLQAKILNQQVNGSTDGWGVSNNLVDKNETFVIDFSEPVVRTAITFSQYDSGEIKWVAYGADDTTVVKSGTLTGADSLLVVENLNNSIGKIELSVDPGVPKNAQYKVVTISAEQISSTEDVHVEIPVTVFDHDGDSVDSSIAVKFDNYADTVLDGTDGDDSIAGGAGADILHGDASDDILEGGSGADQLDGGDGTDTLSYEHSAAAVNVDLLNNTVSGGDAEGDTIVNFENVTGSAYDDELHGNDLSNILVGGDGDDIFFGGGGADTFVAGEGGDTLTDYDKTQGDVVDISSVLDSDAGDYLGVDENVDGSARLQIFDSGDVEKGSVTFDNISYDDLSLEGPGNELDTLLGRVDVHDGTV